MTHFEGKNHYLSFAFQWGDRPLYTQFVIDSYYTHTVHALGAHLQYLRSPSVWTLRRVISSPFSFMKSINYATLAWLHLSISMSVWRTGPRSRLPLRIRCRSSSLKPNGDTFYVSAHKSQTIGKMCVFNQRVVLSRPPSLSLRVRLFIFAAQVGIEYKRVVIAIILF